MKMPEMPMTLSVFLLLILLLGGEGEAQITCGGKLGILCPDGMCCSNWGYCGTTDGYCGPGNCQLQCPPPPPPPPPPVAPPPGSEEWDISSLIPSSLFNEMLPYRDDLACPARGFYTYEGFIRAARFFPAFGNVGNETTRKREIAAFFGQTSHETGGGWDGAPGGRFSWGYCHKVEMGNPGNYSEPSEQWPCVPGKKYYGRGPIQLSWNFNYGQAGTALGLDLLSNPDLVENDPSIAFRTSLWFWMTPQAGRPSCHEIIMGRWEPSYADIVAGRLPGYGATTNLINGPLECGKGGPDGRVESRIGFYKRYCDIYGIDYGDNLDCYDQQPFFGESFRASI